MEGTMMDAAEQTVKGISAEISRLREQQHAMHKEAERAVARLKELSSLRSAFAPETLLVESGAPEELAAVMGGLVEAFEEETEVLSRTKDLYEDAVLELDRLSMRAEVRYHQAKKQLAERRYEALCKERYAHDEDAEEVVGVLVKVLDRLEGLGAEQARAASDAEKPSPHDPRATIEHWLARRLGRWLSLESSERYDAPLPELDPLALRPEPERGDPGAGDAGTSAGPEMPGSASAVPGAHPQSRRGT